jgi:hypothetical protein
MRVSEWCGFSSHKKEKCSRKMNGKRVPLVDEEGKVTSGEVIVAREHHSLTFQ